MRDGHRIDGPLLIQSGTISKPAGYFNYYWNPWIYEEAFVRALTKYQLSCSIGDGLPQNLNIWCQSFTQLHILTVFFSNHIMRRDLQATLITFRCRKGWILRNASHLAELSTSRQLEMNDSKHGVKLLKHTGIPRRSSSCMNPQNQCKSIR